MRAASLLAAALGAAAAAGVHVSFGGMSMTSANPPRPRIVRVDPPPCSLRSEIEAWNAAVDARTAERRQWLKGIKRQRKAARRAARGAA